MNRKNLLKLPLLALVLAFASTAAIAQSSALIKRTTYKSDTLDFGVGGTVSIVGAPTGSITIEGWKRNQIEISAEIEVQAENAQDLAKLSEINGFLLDESFGHIRIMSVGTHDKEYVKKVAKKLPKKLLGLPFRIDYKIRVPSFCDLNIDGGNGGLSLSGVEGAMQIKFLQADARLDLIGGTINAVFGAGNVDIAIPTRSWRGRHASVQLASGTLSVRLAPDLNAEVNATVLRTGQIENSYEFLKPRDRSAKFTEKSVAGKAGNGGAMLSFTVGDGTLQLKKFEPSVSVR